MVKPPQRPYEQALERGFRALRARVPPAGLDALGAEAGEGVIRVKALNHVLTVNLDRDGVTVDGDSVRARNAWAVLALHYLCAADAPRDTRPVSFGDFPDGLSYTSVFMQRIVGRFLATSGQSAERFIAAAERNGGMRLPGREVGYRFTVLPRVPIAFFRYEGDTEVTAGASVVYQADVGALLPAEDRVVAAEVLLDALVGKPMTEPGGQHADRT